ncbi:CDP-diacylglycerol--serine O-phosphatidyltransferase [Lottiidibacillus patelloidae]|uniref:CDP-diacylglycerol--serine O-phosphatidyltransferase n=1 Tax=Lottiidibacillus patelloidae TaxID=2670334 RepID=A0A263BVR1_9BACI|nr:CDP-diacylglycerol--serine O-phosphatidyltransferase [Lottiidibacillus patelloidae]OZM57785.1 CDP-diacylglycerol--serine O-phosphatidyltransferase [Lottiidibacillus patelloidae]
MFITERIDNTIKKIKGQAANALTVLNLSFGSAAIIFLLNDNLVTSFILILLAALCDRFDGLVARKLNIVTDFGKQLDSLCDLVSFGIAPAFLLYAAVLHQFGVPGVIFTIIFVVTGALRLARFNLSESSAVFTGLPITAAGSLLAISSLLVTKWPPQVFMYLILILALLMISNFKMKKI